MRVAYKPRAWFRTETKQNGIVPESDEGGDGSLALQRTHVELEPGGSGAGLAAESSARQFGDSTALAMQWRARLLRHVSRFLTTTPPPPPRGRLSLAQVTAAHWRIGAGGFVPSRSSAGPWARSVFFLRPRGRGHALSQASLLDRSCFGSCTLSHLVGGISAACPICGPRHAGRRPSSRSS